MKKIIDCFFINNPINFEYIPKRLSMQLVFDFSWRTNLRFRNNLGGK
jgi:hypothetical protein